MKFTIETEQETDGRWIAEVMELPGVMVYGLTVEDEVARVRALAERVIAERVEWGENMPRLDNIGELR